MAGVVATENGRRFGKGCLMETSYLISFLISLSISMKKLCGRWFISGVGVGCGKCLFKKKEQIWSQIRVNLCVSSMYIMLVQMRYMGDNLVVLMGEENVNLELRSNWRSRGLAWWLVRFHPSMESKVYTCSQVGMDQVCSTHKPLD